ncbi:MAG: tetratricopeptide repeat protein [Rhizobiales bacterium]|nr:tetratricopeptide repeat protein [Hyphomicrobiales bacterium]OJY03763.1 MAG: 2-hydroxy-6-oxo-2,4-heptadienoate hydrolase [Rhizobiales bacterium 63-22]
MRELMRMRNVFACLAGIALIAAAMPALAQMAPEKAPLTGPSTPDGIQQDQTPQDESPQGGPAESSGVDTSAPAEPAPVPAAQQTREQRLDALFKKLGRETNEAQARNTAAQINRIWAQSGSATVDLLLQWAAKATQEKRYVPALDFLDEAIALDPDYAEAWSRRATVHLLQKDYDHAMVDIDHTLALEPRHFGALFDMATILRARGLKEQAMEVYARALALYPMMLDAQTGLNDLADELTDTRT